MSEQYRSEEYMNLGPSQSSFNELVKAAYVELNHLVSGVLRGHYDGYPLRPTALVHEAYLRLQNGDTRWANHAHFFAAASRALRQLLVEAARRRGASRRHRVRVTFEDLHVESPMPGTDILSLNEAMKALSKVGDHFTRLMEMLYFAGCSIEETAELLGCSVPSVERDAAYSLGWIEDYMQRRDES